MAPRGGSAPRGAQVVDPAGAGDRWLPMGVGGRTGWSRDVREAAAEKGGSSAPAGAPSPSRGRPCAPQSRYLHHHSRGPTGVTKQDIKKSEDVVAESRNAGLQT